jgi:death-on-curing protein
MSRNWKWVSERALLAAQVEQIAEHGGVPGVGDLGLLQSALARPQNLVACGDPDACDLAAAYAYGIARNHPFADGNKRAALVAALGFLELNGYDLTAPDADLYRMFYGLAAGEISEAALADWFRARVQRR